MSWFERDSNKQYILEEIEGRYAKDYLSAMIDLAEVMNHIATLARGQCIRETFTDAVKGQIRDELIASLKK